MIPKFVICGVEHSGTTLLSDLFRQVPELDSGFEVGLLLCDSPREFREFEPFSSNLKSGWGVTGEQFDDLCNSETFEEFYVKLGQASAVINKSCEIFDKTPRYFIALDRCVDKVPCKFIATFKDPRSIVFSDFRRAKTKDFFAWYNEYKTRKLRYLSSIYKQYIYANQELQDRVLCVRLEDIALDTRKTLEKIFQHVGYDFKLEYLLLKNLRYPHTKGNHVSSRIPFEYLGRFNKKICDAIEQDFSELSEWFYN